MMLECRAELEHCQINSYGLLKGACMYLCGHFWYHEALLKEEDNGVFS